MRAIKTISCCVGRVIDAVPFFLPVMFFVAVVGKVVSPWGLVDLGAAVAQAWFIPSFVREYAPVAVPIVELVVVVLFFIPRATIVAAVMSMVLFVLYAVYLGLGVYYDINISCNCFGSLGIGFSNPVYELFLNIGFFVLSAVWLWRQIRQLRLQKGCTHANAQPKTGKRRKEGVHAG